MDVSLSSFVSAEPMLKVRKWLSIGAGAAGFILPLYFLITGIGFDQGLLAVLLIIFIPLLAAGGALSGADFICKKGPGFLNRLPAPLLIGLGLMLGGLIVIIGVICLALGMLAEISLFS